MITYMFRRRQFILALCMVFLICNATEARRAEVDAVNVKFFIDHLGVQDDNYEWETMYKKGSNQWDIDVNHIYIERQYRFTECLIRTGHGNSWKFYIASANINLNQTPEHEIISLSLNLMWKGQASVPKIENSVQHGGNNFEHYNIRPYFDDDKKIREEHLAIIKYIQDSVTFYPQKIIWTERNNRRPLLPHYDYYKYDIPGNWISSQQLYNTGR